jgi:hypothetical protein
MPADDDEKIWRPVLVGLGAMAGAAIVVGLVIGLVLAGAANVGGLGSGGSGDSSENATLFIPPLVPTTSSAPAGASGAPSDDETAKKHKKKHKKKKKEPALTLSAFPETVAPSERINLTGVYKGGEGAVLQVQRLENGSWDDFPTKATVRGGIFTTWVITGRTGENRFRVYDPAADKASAPVTVTVG